MSRIKDYARIEIVYDLIEKAAERVKLAMMQPCIAVRHNTYTDYCLALIFSATGHRPIVDPIQDQKLFDIKQGWMLISDKVVREELAWRVVALPPVACDQLKYYQDYLSRLVGWISPLEEGEDLTVRLNGLINGKPTQPFFFYLDESNPLKVVNITPAEMQSRMKDFWNLPLYLLRHIAATELTESSCDASLAQIQLGHFSGPDHPFGMTATESVKDRLGQANEHIESFMKKLGWRALRSPMRTSPAKTRKIVSLEALKVDYTAVKFGAEKRKIEREKRKRLVKDVIRRVVKEVIGEIEHLSTADELNEIFDRSILAAHEGGLSKNRCVILITRYVRAFPSGKKLLKEVNRNYEVLPETSPFEENSLISYRYTEQVRQNFISYLGEKNTSNKTIDTELRIAEIIFSAALFSGIAEITRLKNLKTALLNTTFQYDEELFVDISLTDNELRPVVRWFPDKISTALILGLYKNSEIENTCDDLSLRRVIDNLSIIIGLEKSTNEPLLGLIKAAKAGVLFDAPGHIASYLMGTNLSVSLPLRQWIRFRSGLALKECAEKALILEDKGSAWLVGINSWKNKNSSSESNGFLKLLRELFTESRRQSVGGNKQVSTRYKEALLVAIKEKFSVKETGMWSSLPIAIISWVIYLVENGTRSKDDLAFNTIDKYSFLVARKLLRLQPVGNFLTLDSGGFEELYLTAIETTENHQKKDLEGRIREFHSFLVDAFSAEELNWSLISSDYILSYADANAVSEQEYLEIIKAVHEDKSINLRMRYQYVFLLMLGYRFGLRFGEAYRLRYIDIITVNQTQIFILVRNSIYGETKSNSGVRQVALLEVLSELECEAFSKVYEYAQIHFETDKQVTLMTLSPTKRELINRFTTISDLSKKIKSVTGDSTLRYQHLRHSYSTRIYASLMKTKTGFTMASTAIISRALEDNIHYFATNFYLRSIAEMVGHRSEKTTLASYIHSIDKAAQNVISLDNYIGLVPAYSYALAISQNNVSQRLVRGKLYIPHNKIPVHNVELIDRKKVDSIDDQVTLNDKKLNLYEMDLLLKRFLLTKQKVDRLAHQLMFDQEEARNVVLLAANIERESGFDYYQADYVNYEKLFNNENNYFQEVRSNRAEDFRISSLLEIIDGHLLLLDKDKVNALKLGLEVWRKTLDGHFNIVTDREEKELLKVSMNILPLGVKVIEVLPNELKGEVNIETGVDFVFRSRSIPRPSEKTKTRLKSSIAIHIKPSGLLKTNQSLGRLLTILSIYLISIDGDS